MEEVAFMLDRNQDLYRKYMKCKKEKQKFVDIASEFFDSHGMADVTKFAISERLTAVLTPEKRKELSKYLLKDYSMDGSSMFKVSSQIQKMWEKEVVSKIDMKTIKGMKFWYFPYMFSGTYALWDFNDNVYGYLATDGDDKIKLTADMIPIKMSEYYIAKERAEESDRE